MAILDAGGCPSPKGRGVVVEKRQTSVDHLSPRRLVGFLPLLPRPLPAVLAHFYKRSIPIYSITVLSITCVL